MTYDEFRAIEYEVMTEKDYYCYKLAVDYHPKEEDVAKYDEYVKQSAKINNFKKKVLAEALKNLPKDYFN